MYHNVPGTLPIVMKLFRIQTFRNFLVSTSDNLTSPPSLLARYAGTADVVVSPTSGVQFSSVGPTSATGPTSSEDGFIGMLSSDRRLD